MVHISNIVVTTFSIVTLVISILAIIGSTWFYLNSASVCQKAFLQRPLLITGVVLLALSSLGLGGSYREISWLLRLYLIVMVLGIVALLGLTIFGVLVMNKSVGEAISRRGFKEYRLMDFSNWMQNNVVNEKHWYKIKSCMVDAKVCKGRNGRVGKMSSTESGCCKPPPPCGFEYQNGTIWEVPKSGPAVPDSDCNTWSNDRNALCFDCNSCKAGFIVDMKKQWMILAIAGVCITVVFIVVYVGGCIALRTNKEDSNRSKRYKNHA